MTITVYFVKVCYGMIYGVGSRTLGDQLGVPENEALVFSETFKARYPGNIALWNTLLSTFNHLYA